MTTPSTDWRLRFTADQIFAARVAARRPERGLVTAIRGGPLQLHAWDVTADTLRPLSDDRYGVMEGWLDPAGRFVHHLRDETGSEHGHLVRAPFEGGPAVDLTPGLPPYTLRGVGFGGGLCAINPVNADGFSLYVIDVPGDGPPGEPRLLYRDTFETWGALLSADGTLAACWSTARAGGIRQHTLLVLDTRTGERVAELAEDPGSGVTGVAFSPVDGDDRLLARTNRSGYRRPVIWNPRTGDRRDIELDLPVDVVPLDWSPDAGSLLLCALGGPQRLYRFDLGTGTAHRLAHPAGTYFGELSGGPQYATAGTLIAVWQQSREPARVLELDATTGEPLRTMLHPAEVPPARPWSSVTVTSADGTPVQVFVATPPGDGPFPTILETHGGPHIALDEFFDFSAATWTDHGYAWISPNYRGSTGFGRAFTEQIWGRMGHLELQDIEAALEWAVGAGIARPDEVIVHGASYGGYLTLYALGRRPDLWAGGIAVAAEGDLVASYHECSDALRAALGGWMHSTPEERPEAWRASSPITYVPDVTAPLLVIQLAEDTRTPPGQMRNYEARMRELGKSIEVDWLSGGHTLADPGEFVAMYERMLGFAAGVLARRRAGG